MPRSPRADEAGGLYYALNRGNLRAKIFHKHETMLPSKKYFMRLTPFVLLSPEVSKNDRRDGKVVVGPTD